ncbi:hypothetical protein PLCT2_01787 [Planctomycetaceae bacterium]|nr:hypothetical protein PLCT2_01787 [Planctomycetaceae bacterium]
MSAPPFNEAHAIAGIIRFPELLPDAVKRLGTGDEAFVDRRVGACWRVVLALTERHLPITPISTMAELSGGRYDAALDMLPTLFGIAATFTSAKDVLQHFDEVERGSIERDLEGDNPPNATKQGQKTPVLVRELREILYGMQHAEPRVSTGIVPWDGCSDGGIKLASLSTMLGPPGAGKTTLLVQVMLNMMQRGIACGWVAIDEDPASILLRLMQAVGIPADEAKKPSTATVERTLELLSTLPFLIYDQGPIEDTIADLAWRFPNRTRVLFIDSLQSAVTRDSKDIPEARLRLDDVMRTAKRLAASPATKCAVIATSELSRGAYRNKIAAMNIESIAGGKESGGIEYQCDSMLDVRLVKGAPDLVSVEAVKMRGPGTRRGTVFTLKLDRATATFLPTDEDVVSMEGLAEDAALRALGDKVLQLIAANPGCSSNFVCTELHTKRTKALAVIEGLKHRKVITKDGAGGKGWRVVPLVPTGSGN